MVLFVLLIIVSDAYGYGFMINVAFVVGLVAYRTRTHGYYNELFSGVLAYPFAGFLVEPHPFWPRLQTWRVVMIITIFATTAIMDVMLIERYQGLPAFLLDGDVPRQAKFATLQTLLFPFLANLVSLMLLKSMKRGVRFFFRL